jgi:uncharacterized protein with von Willebrand factor type A (vWA) domain
MSNPDPLPRAVKPFVEFPAVLRAHGFTVAPEQTTAFLTGIGLVGPRSIEHIRRVGRATLAPPPERRAEFDVLFDHYFLGIRVLAPEIERQADEEEMRLQEEGAGLFEPLISDEVYEAGQQASVAEALSVRRFAPADPSEALRRFARLAPARLPRRKGYRRTPSPRGRGFDFRRTLREAVRHEGDVMRLRMYARKRRQRAVLLLIDVSGSMKEHTDSYLRFAHTLARASDRIEVLTIGTRLTRVTRAMRLRNVDQALAAAAGVVSDWDGGTRIGEALQALLGLPRLAGYANGALTLMVSDGLERGDHAAMTDAVVKLARRSWRLHWLTPLAADPNFQPLTPALKSVLPFIDELADGSSIERLCEHVLELTRRPLQ